MPIGRPGSEPWTGWERFFLHYGREQQLRACLYCSAADHEQWYHGQSGRSLADACCSCHGLMLIAELCLLSCALQLRCTATSQQALGLTQAARGCNCAAPTP